MAQYSIDFTLSESEIQAQFTTKNTGNPGVSVVDVNGTPTLEFLAGGAYWTALWNPAGNVVGKTQVLVYESAPVGYEGVYTAGPAVYLNAGQESHAFSSVCVSSTTNSQQLKAGINNLAKSNGGYTSGADYHWRLLEIDGSTLRHVAWSGAFEDKPGTWDNETTSSTYTSGGIGCWGRGRTGNALTYRTQVLSVGTNGDPAVPPSAGGPVIDVQPQNQTVTEPDPATFTVSATTSGGTLSYQWKDDGSNVGTNSSTYNTGATSVSMNGSQITVDVTDDNGTTTSSAATLTVNAVGGLNEFYVAKGGSFVKSAPHVAKGGSFVEPDSAWVVKSGAWVKVYEK